ncbi:MAG: peptidyl-prolyl cis-trans isomerase [Fodinibius sp.]|nr:peptidyl-prolyl cis-trans isomerase [Fodinibius sp.]
MSTTIFAYIFGGLLLLSGCTQQSPNNAEDMLARVGNTYLTIEQAKSDIPDFVMQSDSISALHSYREEWVREQVLLQEANRLNLAQEEEVRKKLEQARQEVLREALKDYVMGAKQEDLEVTDAEVRSYYQANKEQFALNEDFVQFRHLRTRTITDARAARQDLLDGVSWPEVANQYGINPEVAINESEQYWPISMAAQNIDIMNRYLNIIGQSEISPIQRVNGVYHFVQLMDKRSEGDQPNLDWLMNEIKDWMILNKRRQNFSSYVKNLYLKAKSNNEVETFNVLPTQTNKSNQKPTVQDTLESNSANE